MILLDCASLFCINQREKDVHLVSVNVGKTRKLDNAKPLGITGIFKLPTQDAVFVSPEGLAGDTICDTENHGGLDQAVYVYGTEDYAWWSRQLGQELAPGTFGENLTLSEFTSATSKI